MSLSKVPDNLEISNEHRKVPKKAEKDQIYVRNR